MGTTIDGNVGASGGGLWVASGVVALEGAVVTGNEGGGLWEKRICRTIHTARRDHKDGSIKAGERYAKYTYRAIGFDDGSERGTCYHRHFKRRFELVAAGLPNERWAEAYCD